MTITVPTNSNTIVKITDALRRAFGDDVRLVGLLRDAKGSFAVAWYKPTTVKKSGTHLVCWTDEGERAFLEGGHYFDGHGVPLTENDFCGLASADLRERVGR